MKSDDKAAWRPRRFDVAGAHPDEVYRAVSNIAEAVDEIGKQVIGGRLVEHFGDMDPEVQAWRRNKPLRFGPNRDADVQQFLAQGVRILDDFNEKMPLGLRDTHRQVRNRCHELARGMERVLAKRPDERFQFDPRYASWRRVEIYAETAPIKDDRLRVLSGDDMRRKYLAVLSRVFRQGPAQAARAKAAYHAWEENAERLGANRPIAEAARPWKRFLDSIETMRMRDGQRGAVWGYVDPVNGIDFRPALTQRPTFNSKPRMRI